MEPIKSSFQTEFDALLAGFKRKVFTILGIGLSCFVITEALFIFFVVDDKGAVKIQSLNGALVMAGGILVVTITSLYLILPTKLIAYESLKLVRSSSDDMNKFISKASPTVDKVDALTVKLEGQMNSAEGELKQLTLDVQAEGRMIREELAGIRKAFTTKIESPIKRIQPAKFPLEMADGELAETRAKNGNGSASG